MNRKMRLRLIEVKEASGEAVNSPDIVAKIMEKEARADRECFWVLHLNNANRIIEKELVSIGTLNASPIHPREVFKKAILLGAKGIVTVHNHPSGNLHPSYEDKEIWIRLKKAGEILGIEVMDHIILAPSGSYFSKRDEKFVYKERKEV